MDNTIINIGRQFGAGGLLVANELGAALDIPVYNKELINKAAEMSGFSKELFEKRDEKRGFKFFHNVLGVGRGDGIAQSYLNDDSLFKMQSSVIRDIAEKGSAIFVGRAANYVLRDMQCLDVFICAPLADRIKRVAGRLNITPSEAESLIQKKERARQSFYNFFTFGEWGFSQDYDLSINSSMLGLEETAKYIIDFGKKSGMIK